MYLLPLAHSGLQSTAGLGGIDPRDLSERHGAGPQQGRADGIWGDEVAMEKWGGGARALAEAGCPEGSGDKAQAAD